MCGHLGVCVGHLGGVCGWALGLALGCVCGWALGWCVVHLNALNEGVGDMGGGAVCVVCGGGGGEAVVVGAGKAGVQ